MGERFKNFNTGGYIMRTACRKYIAIGGWHNSTACRNGFLQAVLRYPPVETLDFHKHPAHAVLQSACGKGLGTACIVVLCTSDSNLNMF